jgi:hypothetical protein
MIWRKFKQLHAIHIDGEAHLPFAFRTIDLSLRSFWKPASQRALLISLQYNQLLSQGKILSSQICDDIKLALKPIAELLDEKQDHQTLIWKRPKHNDVNV